MRPLPSIAAFLLTLTTTLLALFVSLGFLMFFLPLLLALSLIGMIRGQQKSAQRRPIIIEHPVR